MEASVGTTTCNGAAQDGASGVSASGQRISPQTAQAWLSVARLPEGDYSAAYQCGAALGSNVRLTSLVREHDFHIKNANIGLNLPFGNGVDLTVGLFDTIVGYEVEASGSNPNVNRSYGYDLEPFTHTGLLASTSSSDSDGIDVVCWIGQCLSIQPPVFTMVR